MIRMETEYNGYQIKYDDWSKFTVYKDDTQLKRDLLNLEACEKWIEKREKTVYKRVSIISNQYNSWKSAGDPFEPGEATSVVDSDRVWITNGKKRSTADVRNLYLDTPENRAAIEIIKTKIAEVKKLELEVEAIFQDMPTLTTDMLIEGDLR